MSNESILLFTKSEVMTINGYELGPKTMALPSFVPDFAEPKALFTMLKTQKPELISLH